MSDSDCLDWYQQQPSPEDSQVAFSSTRKRAARATNSQIEALVTAIESRPFMATRRFTGPHGKKILKSMWKEVAADLNSSINGAVKSPDQWITVWRDLKSRASIKALKLKKEHASTGKRAFATPPLSGVEKRIISIIGGDFTAGINCPDSMPEDDIQQRVGAGVFIKYLKVPETASGSSASTSEVPVLETQIIASDGSDTEEPSPEHQVRSRRHRNLNPRGQHNSARADNMAVAETNAQSMRMIAESAKMQAEAAKMQAEASLLFAQAANKIADAILSNNKNKNS